MRAIEGIREITGILKGYGIADPGKEAELILTRCAGVERLALYRDDPALSAVQEEEIKKAVERRQKREPFQYIIGDVDFYGLKITVGPGVLIPRPETELLVDEAIKTVTSNESRVTGNKGSGKTAAISRSGERNGSSENLSLVTCHSSLKILDLCTGSGCIALSLGRHFAQAEVVGVDISDRALQYARTNAAINNIRNVTFLRGNLYEPVKGEKFDVIVSNPPYIKRQEIKNLDPEIRMWEPNEALDGGEDGLQYYKTILSQAPYYITDAGSVILELEQGEAEAVSEIAAATGLMCAFVTKDYAGIERVGCYRYI